MCTCRKALSLAVLMVEGFSSTAAEKLARCVTQQQRVPIDTSSLVTHNTCTSCLVNTDRGLEAAGGRHEACLVCQAAGVHPVPSRTRQLSPPAPMVLGWQRPGRLGPRQAPLSSPSSSPCRAV